MIFLSMIQKNFGYKPILKGFSMSVHPGEKIGLIGPNGSGKTTLIKMIVGEETPDQGTISVAGNPRFGYLHQIPQGDVALTVRQRLLQGIDHLVKMEEALRSLEAQMSELNPGNNEAALLMAQYDQLLAQFERLGGYQYESKIDSVVQGLGLTVPWESLLGDLSGGERARLELAVVLLSEPDVLLLDEPTNHLDFPALTWLENYISSFRGTALIISHDRYFLDRTVEKIVELDKGVAREFAGNYSFYLEERERLYIQESKQYDTQQKQWYGYLPHWE
jgi:ATP-binding cassette subfamily F protein 3